MKPIGTTLFFFAVLFVAAHARTLTTTEQNNLLQFHNRVRADVAHLAVSMPNLIWDSNLANVAKTYAETCVYAHNANREEEYQTASGSTLTVGENLAVASSSSIAPVDLTSGWEDEKNDWNYATGCDAGKDCLHYTQLVWAATTRVGCGFQSCTNVNVGGTNWPTASILVCNYASAGNILDENPWEPAPPSGAISLAASGIFVVACAILVVFL